MGYDWVKLHTKMMSSTLNWEMDLGGFGFFAKLLLLAGRDSPRTGQIKFANEAHLGQMLNCSEEDCKNYLNRLKSTFRISERPSREGRIIRIVNWKRYQKLPKEKVVNQESPKKGVSGKPYIDKIRRDEKRREERGENGLLPTPRSLDFSIKKTIDQTKLTISNYREILKEGPEACMKKLKGTPEEIEAHIKKKIAEVNRVIKDTA